MGSFSVWHWLIYLLFLALYHALTTVAIVKKSEQALKVQLINIFLGWTVIGWFFALYLALKKAGSVIELRSL